MAFQRLYGEAVFGTLGASAFNDLSAIFYGSALAGTLGHSSIQDNGAPFYGVATAGTLGVTVGTDEFIILIEDVSCVASIGTLGSAVMFYDIDPASFVVTRLPAGELSGSGSEEAQLGGDGSVAGQIVQDWENN